MKTFACLSLLCALILGGPATAQDRVTLGWGRLFTNDAIGDVKDRWRTGSYTVSKLTGPRWGGDLPTHLGQVLEYRFAADIYAPASLTAPDPTDRRYAGALSFGVATHFDLDGFNSTLGSGLSLIGPSTGIGTFQSGIHALLGMDAPTTALDDQIEDQVQPYALTEVSRDLPLGDMVKLRPFVAAQLGAEDILRAGGDLILGRFGRSDLLLRDATTGQLYRGIAGDTAPQMSLILGADRAQVFDSVFLPEGGAAVLTPTRDRLRAGYLWQGEKAFVFSGLTYLSPEFDSQPEGQVVGSLTLSFDF